MAAQDPIDRACERNFVKAGSPLEQTVRLHAWKFFAADGSALDEKLDSYFAEQRSNEFFKNDFAAAPPPRAQGLDTLHISPKEFGEIRAGELVVAGDAKETASLGPGTFRPSVEELDRIRATGKVG